MSVVSSTRRQKSWQIADKLGSLLDAVNLDREQFTAKLRALSRAHPDVNSDEDAARLIGVSYRQYQRWLSGESEPRGSSLKLIAEKLGVPLSELLGQPDPSQLDRIEGMLERLLAQVEVSPEEEVDQLVQEIEEESAQEGDGARPGKGQRRSEGASRAKARRSAAARRAR